VKLGTSIGKGLLYLLTFADLFVNIFLIFSKSSILRKWLLEKYMECFRVNCHKNFNSNRELWTIVVPNLINIGLVVAYKSTFKIDTINVGKMGFQAFNKVRLSTCMTEIALVPHSRETTFGQTLNSGLSE
jgi:hypothetical protein